MERKALDVGALIQSLTGRMNPVDLRTSIQKLAKYGRILEDHIQKRDVLAEREKQFVRGRLEGRSISQCKIDTCRAERMEQQAEIEALLTLIQEVKSELQNADEVLPH